MCVVITFGYSKEKKGKPASFTRKLTNPYHQKYIFTPRNPRLLLAVITIVQTDQWLTRQWYAVVWGEFCCDDRLL